MKKKEVLKFWLMPKNIRKRAYDTAQKLKDKNFRKAVLRPV